MGRALNHTNEPLNDNRDDASPRLSIVAPCYNETGTLGELHKRVSAAASGLGCSWELILVNDGSRDETWPMMQDLAKRDAQVVAVNLSRNHGHQLALTAGLTLARGERILMIDADLQDPPELLPDMMKMMDDGVDVVYGKRRQRDGETRFKLATAAGFYWLIGKLTDTPIPANVGDFRLVKRRVLDVLLNMPERHRFIRGMVSWVGFRQEPIMYDRDARFAGETGYPVRKMLRLAIDAVTAFSIKPLQFASLLGIAAAAMSIVVLIYAVTGWAFRETEPGWTSLIAVVAFFGGLNLMVLGVIGEYLGRMYDQSRGRPLFMIADVEKHTESSDTLQTSGEKREEVAAATSAGTNES